MTSKVLQGPSINSWKFWVFFKNMRFNLHCERTRSNEESYLSLRVLVITLNQLALKPRVVRMVGWLSGSAVTKTVIQLLSISKYIDIIHVLIQNMFMKIVYNN